MQISNIHYIESKGFQVKGRIIYKRSESKRTLNACGMLNEKNFFLFKENVHPFKQGTNYFDNSTLVDPKYINYIKEVKKNERNDFDVSFKDYVSTTSVNSVFTKYITQKTRDFLNTDFENHYDIRGVVKGDMKGSVCFPFFNYNNEFVTAQIITYAKDGKRIKNGWSTNWFHSYKDIKKELNLNLKDKYSVSVNCFFGENYLDLSNNIVGIVEAPKTAVILKEIYPNIDWLATAGEQQLFGKNFEVLRDKRVVLFPDAHTTKWKEFGKKSGYNVCEILDIESVEKGSDIADFIFEDSTDVFSDLHEYLFSLNAGYFDVEIDETLFDLNFKVVKDESVYFTALPYRYEGKNLMHQIDDSGNFKIDFDGKHFNLFTDKYSIRNAQIDWHKKDRKDKDTDKLVGFNKDSFVWHLQKSFRILKELNPDTDYKAIFGIALNKLNNESNFSFNEVYVKKVLMPLWESYEVNLSKLNKYRDWKYKGSKQLTRNEFERELNNDRFKRKLAMRLLAFQDVLKEDRFILLETDLGISSHTRGYGQIRKLVKDWNKNVIGNSTLSTYMDRINFSADFEKEVKKLPVYIKDIIWGGREFTFSNISIPYLSIIMGYSTDKVKNILKFKKDYDTETLVKNEVDNLLSIVKNIEPIRLATDKEVRITDFRYIEPANEWASLHKNRGNWFDVKEEDSVIIFLPKEKLILEKEKTTEKVYLDVLDWSIKYLDYLDSLKKEKAESKVIKMSDIEVEVIPEHWYSPDEKLSAELVNF